MLSSHSYLPVFVILVAGCGGSGENRPFLAEQLTHAELATLSDALVVDLVREEYTALGSIPTVGSAAYQGLIQARTSGFRDDEFAFIGSLEIVASFAHPDGVTKATVSQLFYSDGASLPGSLSMTSSNFNREGNPFLDHTLSIGLEGNIIGPTQEEMSLDLSLEGDFFGDDHQFAAGPISGRGTFKGGTFGVNGRFMTEVN